MWKPKNSFQALLPIHIIGLLFCHGVVDFPNFNKTKVIHSILFVAITLAIHTGSFIYVMIYLFDPEWMEISYQISYLINTHLTMLMMIVNIINNWTSRTKSSTINARILKADETLNRLGIHFDFTKEFIFSVKIAVFWVFLLLFMNISKILILHKKEIVLIIFIITVIQHAYYVNYLIDLKFYLVIKHMKLRFKNLNKVLTDILHLQENNSSHKQVSEYKWAISRQVTFEKDLTEILRKLKRIHLELGELSRELMKIYGIPIVFTMIGGFTNTTSFFYFMFITLKDQKMILSDKILLFLSLTVWLTISISKVIIINYICAGTVNEWQKTGEIIHKLEFDSKDSNFQREVQKFSIQMLQNPLKFTPCGYFDLGLYFLREFIGSVSAQTFLLIQTYPIHSSGVNQ